MMQSCPFNIHLLQRSQDTTKIVILAEGEDLRVIEAANMLVESGAISQTVLIGRQKFIIPHLTRLALEGLGSKISIIDSGNKALMDQTKAHCAAMMTAKGKDTSAEQLQRYSSDPLFQAGTLLATKRGDCVLAGATATTAAGIRAALTTIGLSPAVNTVSGCFFLNRSTVNSHNTVEETILFADAGVVIDPTVPQLVDIAVASSQTWSQIMQTAPVVAFLSFSTKGSASHASAEKMALAARQFRERCPNIESDGELQFDAALDVNVGAKKAPGSRVPGRANVFIFPDLNSGNISYKIAQRLAGFSAYGPVLQGLAKPYSDLSRGASASDIAVSALINCLR